VTNLATGSSFFLSCALTVNVIGIKSIRTFDDDVAWPEHALVIQGGSLGGWVWWRDCMLFGSNILFDDVM
jgi:hypothetical protein